MSDEEKGIDINQAKPTQTIYARVSIEAKAWLDEQHKNTGIPIARLLDTILMDAKQRNVSFKVQAPIIVDVSLDTPPPQPAE